MSFFNIQINLRVTEKTKDMIEELLDKYSEKYGDVSDVIRVAVIQLHRREIPLSNIKPEFKTEEYKI